MLAYAASAPRIAERRSNPNAMLAIIAGHVALVAVVMSARMDFPARLIDHPIKIIRLPPIDPPPPPNRTRHASLRPMPGPTSTNPRIPVPPLPGPDTTTHPTAPDRGPTTGPTWTPMPQPLPAPTPVNAGPELVTPQSELKPPYPPSKLLAEEEASLRLSLTIDERGRVVAVEPIGHTDPVFLAAARRYLLAHWRFRPASEDGRAVASTTVITLRFQLDG
jgi:protein TonB